MAKDDQRELTETHGIQQWPSCCGRGFRNPPNASFLAPLYSFNEIQKQETEQNKKMACFVPFNNRNLDLSFFVLRPTVVLVEELVDALKDFSACTETLGCVNSSIFRSIHGNLVGHLLNFPLSYLLVLVFNFFTFNLIFMIFRSFGMRRGWKDLGKTKKCWFHHW